MKQKNKAFTLIELLVVIAIIAILAVIVLIALNTARVKARDSAAVSDLRSIAPALEMYNDTTGAYPIYYTTGYPTSDFDDMVGDLSGAGYLPAGPLTAVAHHFFHYCSTDGSAYEMWTENEFTGGIQKVGDDTGGACST